jgi:hypothetical protein
VCIDELFDHVKAKSGAANALAVLPAIIGRADPLQLVLRNAASSTT